MRSTTARRAATAILLVAVSFAGPAAAETAEAPPIDTDAVDAFVRSQIDKHRVPGLALGIIDDGEIIRLAGFGEAGSGREVSPDTPFVLGSISKSFTAVAVLQLVEQGLIDLDAPVGAYLPDFAVATREASTAITVRHLLSHTSGLSELGYNRVLDRNATLEQAVADLRNARPTAAPGERFQYFNQGYSVLALVVQTVSGQPYGDYATEHIFRPLGMDRSFADRDAARTAGLAQGHSKLFGFPIRRDLPFSEFALGYGHLISTARDLSRFALMIGNDGTLDGATILQPVSVELMRTTPADVADTTYGLGWQTWVTDGTTFEGHTGGEKTFMSSLVLLPEQDRGYVWLMNQEHMLDPVRSQLDNGITALLLGRDASLDGMSMKTLGLALLAAVLIATVFSVRSLVKLRHWRRDARELTTAAIVRKIAPHVIVPVVVLIVAYHYLGPWVLGQPVAWNFRYVGAYYLPEVALLLALAIVPDVIQAAYMTAVAVIDRPRRAPRTADMDTGRAKTPVGSR